MSIEEQTFYGLKGQQHIVQGNALGVWRVEKTPCKGKSRYECSASALAGRKLLHHPTQGVALGCELTGLSGRPSMLYRAISGTYKFEHQRCSSISEHDFEQINNSFSRLYEY